MLGIAVYAAYGMTETVIHATNGKPSEHLPERSMGHVTPGYEFAVVDQETGALCAEGETGELWLRGTRGIQLFLEYYDNDEANAKAFDGDWFKTGDMVVLGTGGNLFYRERDKDLLKVGGENVSAREVEDVVTTVPGVAQVAVVGKHHDFLDQVVVAFVVTAPGSRRGGAGGADHRACAANSWPTSRCRERSTPWTRSRWEPSTRSSRTSCGRWPTSDPPSEQIGPVLADIFGADDRIRTRDPQLDKVLIFRPIGSSGPSEVRLRPPSFHPIHSIRPCSRALEYGPANGRGAPSYPASTTTPFSHIRVLGQLQVARAGSEHVR